MERTPPRWIWYSVGEFRKVGGWPGVANNRFSNEIIGRWIRDQTSPTTHETTAGLYCGLAF